MVVDNDYKMISFPDNGKTRYELYNLANDMGEQDNLVKKEPRISNRLRKRLKAIDDSVTASVNGKDYPEKKVAPQPPRIFWWERESYRPYFSEWIKRPEYGPRLKRYIESQK